MIKILVGLLIFIAFSSFAEEDFFVPKNAYQQPSGVGCTIKEKFYPVGSREQMNHQELAKYKKLTGYQASDGYAVMMQCIYLVNPHHQDHPKVADRIYVWVAS